MIAVWSHEAFPRIEHFWHSIEFSEDSCWLWKGSLNREKYGYHWDGTTRVLAHRFMFVLIHENITQPFVLHSCDNPSCVRPDHLFEGTAQHNTDDMMSKGRNVALKGDQHPRAVLTFDKALEIRELWKAGGYSQTQLARLFGCDQARISRIVNNDIWTMPA